MKAKDGKEFDINTLGKLEKDEVEIIQFLRPDGKRRRMSAKLTINLVNKAKNIILSSEELIIGKIAIYGRKIGQPEEKDYLLIADNSPGKNSPKNVLMKVINHVFKNQG